MIKFAENRLLQVILAPVVSEKSTMLAEKSEQVVFRVSTDATKAEIKAAVELLFKVKVDAVTTINVKGKSKRFGRTAGRRKDWKKAYVSLVAGQEIDLASAQ
ncbi:50S ribosomal protein L23 [Chitinibacter fontanus]|jgi:large subunit ribosomal protein L23|uniref:Large ribosomal subunit protein uL23 n=2 Tax=Chitinibacter TaxID=230666 RepID=A0A7D5V9Z2_9NEIS|nr:50S ribosomal protein L23 [Chitinibacter bivalviorum]QLI81917.1 50S ribosomal protein L23 [Chitinibacter fontanus]